MKNFFKGFFNKPVSQEPATSNSVLLSAISLMIEVSLADEIMDISELETLKKVLLNEFEVKENDLENLISDAKKIKTHQLLYTNLLEKLMTNTNSMIKRI